MTCLGAGLGHGLGGLEVGQLDLEGLAQGPAGAHQHVGGLQVEVGASTPGDVVQSVKNLKITEKRWRTRIAGECCLKIFY